MSYRSLAAKWSAIITTSLFMSTLNFKKFLSNDLISFTQNFNYVSKILYKLQNSNLIDKKCSIKLPHLINEPIFRDSGSGEFNVNIYLTEFKC